MSGCLLFEVIFMVLSVSCGVLLQPVKKDVFPQELGRLLAALSFTTSTYSNIRCKRTSRVLSDTNVYRQ